ncbi:MAG: C-terminal helicase domain-containing protein [Gammaproteobacteria bacterium]|nr:C-terminal helicase domain-containing protein [Gammaproteobacteria bacterium]
MLAHLTRLRLACCNPWLVHPDGPPSSKLRIFAETLDELRRGGHRVLVFSQFVPHLKLIEEHVTGAAIPYLYLDGSTPAKARTGSARSDR